jgi:hypothetical protein
MLCYDAQFVLKSSSWLPLTLQDILAYLIYWGPLWLSCCKYIQALVCTSCSRLPSLLRCFYVTCSHTCHMVYTVKRSLRMSIHIILSPTLYLFNQMYLWLLLATPYGATFYKQAKGSEAKPLRRDVGGQVLMVKKRLWGSKLIGEPTGGGSLGLAGDEDRRLGERLGNLAVDTGCTSGAVGVL